MKRIVAEALTREGFEPFGEVIQCEGAESFLINNDKCERFHALSHVEASAEGGHPVINIFRGQPYAMPLELAMMERHPLGSQAFYPLSSNSYLVVVAEDKAGTPANIRAFMASPDQGINFKPNTWHGVLTPLHEVCDFLVVDRAGPGNNLEEHHFDQPYLITSD